MNSLDTFDYLIIAGILLIFLLIAFIKSSRSSGIFKTTNKLPWWLGAASLFIIYWNPTLDMINTRLVIEKGYSGLWFLKDILLTIGIAPVLFVPMWARLNITTDNELIRLRYSGKSAKILQIFRAIYVGIFISSFLCSFYVLGIKKIVSVYFTLSELEFFSIFFFCSLIILLKNKLAVKVKTDFFVSILYLFMLFIGIYFLVDSLGGWSNMKASLINHHEDKIQLLPQSESSGESYPNILAFMFIQWWSARILDQSNVNSQRYFAIRDSWNAFKAIFLPVLIISITFALSSFIWDAALINNISLKEGEASYISLLSDVLPSGLKGLLIITFILGFITTYEAIVSWGASMITVDLLKDSLLEKKLGYKKVAFGSMLLISLISIAFALKSDSLLSLTKLLFSVSIGVGPVFILRWFWWRINAWSQFSAMLSSGVYALSFDWFYQTYNPEVVNTILESLNINWYVFKLLIITILVTITWLVVTFFTNPDDKEKLKSFVDLTQTGGFWPFKTTFDWKNKIFAILSLSLVGILPIWIIWHLKFGSIGIAAFLATLWLSATMFSYHSVKKIIHKEQLDKFDKPKG